MGKQLGLPACDTLEPLPSPSVMSSQSFVFLLGPANQAFVEVTKEMREGKTEAAPPSAPAPEPETPEPAAQQPQSPTSAEAAENESRKKFTKSYGA